MKYNKLLASVLVAAGMMASAASAATFSLVGGADFDLPAEFNPTPDVGVAVGTTVKKFDSAAVGAGEGLFLSDASKTKFTFLGKEAGATNKVVEINVGPNQRIFNTDLAGSSFFGFDDGGVVDFKFVTAAMEGEAAGVSRILNALSTSGPLGDHLSIGFLVENDRSVLAFFGDGRGDTDLDDMVVRIEAVPLPAGGLLLLGGLGGLAAIRRRKKAA